MCICLTLCLVRTVLSGTFLSGTVFSVYQIDLFNVGVEYLLVDYCTLAGLSPIKLTLI